MKFAAVIVLLLLGACAAVTPKQDAFEIGAKYRAYQIGVLAVVSNPSTPDDVKEKLKLLDRTATPVVLAAVDKAIACIDPCKLDRYQLGVAAAASAITPVYSALIELGVGGLNRP
jgi:hypothetical protein